MAIGLFYYGLRDTTATYATNFLNLIPIATFILSLIFRGPTYPSMFNPLSLVFVAITEAIFFGTSISFGSLIGMAVLIVGFYLFLWGKSMEKKGEAAG
ncbi:unnamed protein product [Cuscuta campestris]|uniref:WAT1-related protein n=1 Tax=Cuscuta campestris TaxID=132261 RepID=A0A484K4M8_9ASTE|nr:unnamed protein product [Cuscuta campestris]